MAVLPAVAAALVRSLGATMRIRHVGREGLDGLEAAGERYIHAFWHSRLLFMPYSYRGERIALLISQHRDGEYITRAMRCLRRVGGGEFEVSTVRGSSTRGGAAALRGAVRKLRDGWDVGITPDGPRGPRHEVQPGAIEIARLSGAALVPVAFAACPAWEMNSWDRFLVPRPFARGLFLYGEPITVPRQAGDDRREVLRSRLEETLTQLTRRAQRDVRMEAA
jgi:lysophospholipid acyltransferase (LPLAT)-like uncharacterized protein